MEQRKSVLMNDAKRQLQIVFSCSPIADKLELALVLVDELADVLNEMGIKANYESEDVRANKLAECQDKAMEIQQNLCEVMGRELNGMLVNGQNIAKSEYKATKALDEADGE